MLPFTSYPTVQQVELSQDVPNKKFCSVEKLGYDMRVYVNVGVCVDCFFDFIIIHVSKLAVFWT